MYRIMLFQEVFPGKTTIYIDDEDTKEEAEIRAAWKDFFATFASSELCEIHTVGNFIEALGTWLLLRSIFPTGVVPRFPDTLYSHLRTCKCGSCCGIFAGVPATKSPTYR
jgi:hypothetical protein